MSDLMVSALQLTVLGMGMTFLSIGALVGGMFLLTRLTTRRQTVPSLQPSLGEGGEAGKRRQIVMSSAESDGVKMQQEVVAEESEEERRRAVAAAVAVSLALRSGARGFSTSSLPHREREENPWDVYVRGLHLSARSRYDSLRGRR
jgi:hypothetical protein